MPYSEFQHRHNFAVWTAARAAQRGLTTVKNLRDALDQSGVVLFAKKPSNLRRFNEQHRVWCRSISDFLESRGVSGATYGRAAKLVNVYLKSMITIQDSSSPAANIIHPPIDRILIQNLSKKPELADGAKAMLTKLNWTEIDEDSYFELIKFLRQLNGDRPFWMIEEYWTVVN